MSTRGLRESIARLIDPVAFGGWGYALPQNAKLRAQAYSKADAIMALFFPAESGASSPSNASAATSVADEPNSSPPPPASVEGA